LYTNPHLHQPRFIIFNSGKCKKKGKTIHQTVSKTLTQMILAKIKCDKR